MGAQYNKTGINYSLVCNLVPRRGPNPIKIIASWEAYKLAQLELATAMGYTPLRLDPLGLATAGYIPLGQAPLRRARQRFDSTCP